MMAALTAAVAFIKGDWRLLLLLALAVGLSLAAWRIYAAGVASEVARQNAESLEAYREREGIDEQLDRQTIENLCRRAGGGAGCLGLQHGGRPTR